MSRMRIFEFGGFTHEAADIRRCTAGEILADSSDMTRPSVLGA